MHTVSQEDSARPLAWSTPRLIRRGTITDVRGSGQVALSQASGSKS